MFPKKEALEMRFWEKIQSALHTKDLPERFSLRNDGAPETLQHYMNKGKLTSLPTGTQKYAALVWLSDHVTPEKRYNGKEINALLNALHTFDDPATLRRELCNCCLLERTPDGATYWLNPDRPSLEELQKLNEKKPEEENTDLKDAAEFREGIHAEALKRVQAIRPDIKQVVDDYPVNAYLRQIWDYPGAWYTIVAIPESEKSREALLNKIVRETLKNNN